MNVVCRLIYDPISQRGHPFFCSLVRLVLSAPRQPLHPPPHRSSTRCTSVMAIKVDVTSERTPYSKKIFKEDQLVSRTNPLLQFQEWFKEAQKCDKIPEPNAMCLSTCTTDGKPSSRMVLMKTFTEAGFTFFTNYESRKARELEENPHAALLFYWPQLHYQVRIEGTIKRLPEEESAAYFSSRPKSSQASAASSCQSREISSREEMVAKQSALLEKYGGDGQVIPKPDYWGGYILSPAEFEFWLGQSNRLHDRIVFTKATDAETWSIKRLSP